MHMVGGVRKCIWPGERARVHERVGGSTYVHERVSGACVHDDGIGVRADLYGRDNAARDMRENSRRHLAPWYASPLSDGADCSCVLAQQLYTGRRITSDESEAPRLQAQLNVAPHNLMSSVGLSPHARGMGY